MAAITVAPRSTRPAPVIVRSSAIAYLTFVVVSGNSGVEAVYADENVWLTQKMMAALYNVTVQNIGQHLRRLFTDDERFFATAQNKLFRAIHGHTAAEVIVERADASRAHIGLNSWTADPAGQAQTFDVDAAKNYLTSFMPTAYTVKNTRRSPAGLIRMG